MNHYSLVQNEFTGKELSAKIKTRSLAFNKKLGEIIGKSIGKNEMAMASYALSNLLGGISYFHGTSIVINENKQIQRTKASSLFTDVPCRPFFPRGFLWDSGFHNLLISKWDTHLR